MPVPTTIADLSATASSNSPAGADQVGTSLDDYLRAIQAIIKQESVATIDLSTKTITGTLSQFNTACSDANFASLTGAEALTNKTALAATNTIEARSGPDSTAFSHRNKLINGDMRIDQERAGAAQTFTAGAALAYNVDQWYGYCTGANVTGQRVAGTAPNQYNYRYTGAASVTKIGHAQRIEAANCQDLAGTTARLAVDLANSLLTTVTWTAWYANTADTFGTLASPTRTQIATGTFTVTSTLARYSTAITIPSAATTGLEVEFSVAAQTSGTWTIGRAQFEAGSVATPFEHRPIGTELALCQRYYYRSAAGNNTGAYAAGLCDVATNAAVALSVPVCMRAGPTLTWNSLKTYDATTAAAASAVSITGLSDVSTFLLSVTTSGMTVGRPILLQGNSSNSYIALSARL